MADDISLMTHLDETWKARGKEAAAGLDLGNTSSILKYGIEAQKQVMVFTGSSLFRIPSGDLNEAAADIGRLLDSLQEFEKAVLHEKKDSLKLFRSRYDTFSYAMDECARRLEIHRDSVMRHSRRLDTQYEKCLDIVREYDSYIFGGRERLAACRQGEIRDLSAYAKKTGMREDTLKVSDLVNACGILEERLRDLAASRALPLQIMAQIRLMQSTDALLARNLQTQYTDIFPLFRSRVVLSLGLSPTDAQTADRKVFQEACADLRKALEALLKLRETEQEKQEKSIRLFGK